LGYISGVFSQTHLVTLLSQLQSHWNDEKNNRLEAKKKLVCMRENAESVDRIEIYELDRRRA
jgi:hypothetical protein